MKQHMTYERRRIVGKRSEQGEREASAEAAAEIGSRVFPLPTPAAATMLTVARKSSTRVFVPRKAITDKQTGKVNYPTRVLRSGKRLYLSEPVEKTGDNHSGELADIRWLEGNEKGEGRLSERVVPESDGNEIAAPEVQGLGKMYENVYSRKRQRIPSIGWVGLDSSSSNGGGEAKDRRFRVVFSRKSKKKKPEVINDVGKVRGDQFGETENFFRAGVRHDRLQIREFNRNFLENIDESELLTSFSDPLVLVVLLEFSSDVSLLRFRRFLISVINWMSKARMSLPLFTAFLLSEPMSSTFPRHGIHFLPLVDRNSKFLLGSSISNFGTCKIYSSRESLPLISLNFRALPSYFMSLYLASLLGSQYLPLALSTYLMGLNKKLIQDTQCEDCVSHVPMETDFSGTSLSVSASPAVNRNTASTTETSAVAQSTGILRGSELRKLQRRRSFLRQSRTHNFSSMDCHSTLCSSENGALSLVDPLRVRHLETFDEPFISSRDKVFSTSPSSTSPGSHLKLMEVGKKSHGEQMKEKKAALSDIKQNIDSVLCNANILVTAGDRCWREEGAEVLLELSSSGDWCLAVKIGSNLRYLHRPQDMKSTLNRFTHAYMWIGEDGWRLEFSEKWDWLTFKELHAECRQRNNHPKEDSSVKVIPVPVFKDVPDYEVDRVSSFERPEQYIHMKHDDEILRATVSGVPYYDMDSGDEEWLNNSSSSIIQNGISSYLLEDTFERMIFTFENNAYCSSNVISLEREPNNHEELGSKDMVADVYNYWLKKRKQKGAPLVRVFQGLSLRKPQLMQRQVLRKRRSLKRQRSQVGRGKPAYGFDSKAKEEAKADALLKVHEAENAWRWSMEAAVPLRHRAQLLMENADLAAYKSVMALRISEAIGSMSTEVVSSILDCLPEI